MDHYWLDKRHLIHDKMRWVFVIHIIEYVIGTCIYKYVNRQRLALSHEQPPQLICLWVGMRQYTNDDKWVNIIHKIMSVALIKYQDEVYNKWHLDRM